MAKHVAINMFRYVYVYFSSTIGSFGLGIAFAMMILGVIFTGRSVARIREFKMRLLGKMEAGKK